MLAMKTILYPTDFSADARPAFEVACALAGERDSRLVVLHVERPPLATLGGTAGVPHGYTSCVMLPHVLRFNYEVNAEKQARVSEALGRREESAADVVFALIAGLELPTRLRDVGVKPEQLDLISENSMHDRWVHTNPRKIDGPTVIRALLDAAW